MTSPQIQVAEVLFRAALIDMQRAAALDHKYEEFVAKVMALHVEYTDQLRS